MVDNEQKEKIRNEILNCSNSSILERYDFSLFDHNDVDVFEILISFDNYSNKYYEKLSDELKNNKNIVVLAAKYFHNIPLIPTKFFEDKDVIKSILYARCETQIPTEYLNEDMVNYMFLTSSRCSEEIKPFIDQHLKKETVISVLHKDNKFFSDCVKRGSIACIDNIYIPDAMLKDREIVQLLFIAHFGLVKDNPLIDKELILNLIEFDYAITELPEIFFNDVQLIKTCLEKEANYKIVDNHYFRTLIDSNPDLITEIIKINPHVLDCRNFYISFDIFSELFQKDINNIYYCSQVCEKDEQILYDFLTSQTILNFFKDEHGVYDFSLLHSLHYYKNPIVNNKFIVEQIAKYDNRIFSYMDESIVNDNELMYKIFFEYKVPYNHKKEQIEAFSHKIHHFGNFNDYLENLKLEHDLNQSLVIKHNTKRIKI